jgi:hypothetical protein
MKNNQELSPTEPELTAALITRWRWFGLPGSLVAAVPNRRAFGQVGLTPGLADLIVMSPILREKTGWLELKTTNGRLSGPQHEFGRVCRDLGVPYAVCYGLDSAIEQLRKWGALK